MNILHQRVKEKTLTQAINHLPLVLYV